MATFGQNLRRERELRGVSLREIADATKISIRFLQALEQDRIEILPGGVFRRSFVREYARFIGLDAERVVVEFGLAYGEGVEPGATRPAAHQPHHGVYVIAAALLALVPLLLAKAWRERQPPRPATASSPQPAAPEVRSVVTPEAAPPASTADAEVIELTLNAKERCWVAVRADGRVVLDRVLIQGESEKVLAQGEIVLSVGNAGGITFSVDDRRGVSLGRSGEVRRNIVITRESLPSLVEDASPASAHSS